MVKEKLYASCITYVESRLKNAEAAMDEAQDSANSETKSTAGDKHDTARSMMQLAAEQNAKHLAEARKLQQALSQIDPASKHTKVEVGCLVETSNGFYYLSISAGKIELEDAIYFAISPSAPLAQVLLGATAGDKRIFNGNSILIKSIS